MEKEIKTINETEYVDEEGRVIKERNPFGSFRTSCLKAIYYK